MGGMGVSLSPLWGASITLVDDLLAVFSGFGWSCVGVVAGPVFAASIGAGEGLVGSILHPESSRSASRLVEKIKRCCFGMEITRPLLRGESGEQ